MPLPAGVSTVTVRGLYQHPDGTGMRGTVTLIPTPGKIVAADGGVTVQGAATATLVDGAFTMTVVATDSDGISPTGFTYSAQLSFYDAPGDSFHVGLPKNAPTVSLNALTPASQPEEGEYLIISGPQGPEGPQGPAGATGPQPPLGVAGAGDTVALKSTDATTTNARTPTAHAASHGSGGTDPVTVAQSQVTGLTAALAAALPLSGGALNSGARIETVSVAETDSSGTAESIRLHFARPSGKNGNSAKNAIAWFDDDVSTTQSQVWAQAHRYLHWYNTVTIPAAGVNAATDRITATAHGLPSTPGWKGQWTTTGTLPGGLALATDYYAKRIDNDTLEIYTDPALTAKVDLTSQGSGTHTFTPDNTYFNNEHRHFSIEVSNADLSNKNTRFSIPWGYDTTEIGTFQSNLNVNDGVLRVNGSVGTNRELQFGGALSSNLTPDLKNVRWSVRADSTTESGSNVGSDFRIVRFTDLGAAIDSPIIVKRSNGFVGLGGNTNPQVQLDIGAAASGSWEARVNRGATTNFATQSWATNSVVQWSLQLRNDSTNDLHLRDNVNGRTPLKVRLTTGTVEAGLGFARGRTTVADAAYTVLTTDSRVCYTSLTAARAVTLPSASSASGQEFVIKDESGSCSGTNTITVTPASGTIDGAANKAINTAYGVLRVYSTGTNWFTY